MLLGALFGCLPAAAGEIIIIQPVEKGVKGDREPTRNERELGHSLEKARQYGGKGSTNTVVIENGEPVRSLDKTEQSIRDARDYVRPGRDQPGVAGVEGTTIILRVAPQSEVERQRQKARSYIAPVNSTQTGRDCGQASTSVGMIGEGPGAERSVNVVEKGNSAVNVNCK